MTKSTPFRELAHRFQELVDSLEASARGLPSVENCELFTASEGARKEVEACRKELENSFVTVPGARKLRMVEHEALRAFARANRLGEDVVLASVEINDAGRVTLGVFTEGGVMTDLSALAGLTALTHLYLEDTKVSDVSPLAGLTALTHLYLDDTEVRDVSPLARLTALTRLYLAGTKVSDVSPLAGLTALTHLYLAGTKVSDVSPVTRPGLSVVR